MRTKVPQFELPRAEEVFNLQSETALDGHRLQEEKRLRREAVAQSEARQPVLALHRPAAAAPSENPPLSAKESAARRALKELDQFIGGGQRRAVLQCFNGEERKWFFDKILDLHRLITTMPKTYGQDGKGDQAVVYLHYFAGGQANAWITERDMEPEQHQAFGLADLFGDGGELGYISLGEWLGNNAELDFHFTPCTLGELRQKRALRAGVGAA
jgi:hypothetical protein